MKKIILLCSFLSVFSVYAKANDIVYCAGTFLDIALDTEAQTVTINGHSHKITSVTSVTGDTDFTYHIYPNLSLTLDDQYGDSLMINGKANKITCEGRTP